MNIPTDVVVTPSSLDRTDWSGLKRIATEGSQEQKDCLLAWSYSAVPASLSEELHYLAWGWEKAGRFLEHETTRTVTELNQTASERS